MTTLAATRTTTPGIALLERQAEQTAAPRALAYALFSKLMSSPFDRREGLEEVLGPDEFEQICAQIEDSLPFETGFHALRDHLRRLAVRDIPALGREYSSLFEVGSDGPPVPLRAELVRVNEHKMKEELVRYYNFFSYTLEDGVAWAPDHISILLEFMQVLCLREEAAGDSKGHSFVRAQIDFLDRHIVCWLPVSVGRLVKRSPHSFYTDVMTALWEFLSQDRLWNARSVPPAQEDN